MSLIIEALLPKCNVGEGPFWDADEQCLYFVDVVAKSVCKYNPSTNTLSKGAMPNSSNSSYLVSFVFPINGQKNSFIISYGGQLLKIKWDGVSEKLEVLETIVDLKTGDEPTAVWNDAKVDSNGQIWAGYYIPDTESFSKTKAGGLYTVDPLKKTLKKQLTGISLANGMAWDKSNKKFYFADSFENELFLFDCDIDAAEITNKQILYKCSAGGGFPDGLTIDTNDNLWIATFAKNVIKVDSKKPNTTLQTIELPVEQITSCTFGGADLKDLYVTTASFEMGGRKPDGGWVYRIQGLNVQGTPCQKAIYN